MAGRCGLAVATYAVSTTVTGVTSNAVFTIADVQADDYYGQGEVKFTSGNNNGLPPLKVKSYTGSPLAVTLHQSARKTVQVGDTLDIIPGCRKRYDDDCVTKFSNGNQFGGSPQTPGSDVITKIGVAN